MEKRKATIIATNIAMEWATLPAGRHASWALRLTDVRGFARHLANIDPKVGPSAQPALWRQGQRRHHQRIDRGDGHAFVQSDRP